MQLAVPPDVDMKTAGSSAGRNPPRGGFLGRPLPVATGTPPRAEARGVFGGTARPGS